MITSLLLVRIEMTFKNFVIPIMLFGMGMAFLILSFTNSILLVLVSVCLIGFGQGALFPIIVLKALDRVAPRSEEHTSELQSRGHVVCRLLLEKKKAVTSAYH